ncbi:MAG: prepilin-type N-terminal cleavage/methylation domain-containing protein [Desulfobulbaceae bacterium]|nr:prepilin-type N-terminal cleavage/methylation domain-containing protein [Desulfobulbaceae bacterium]
MITECYLINGFMMSMTFSRQKRLYQNVGFTLIELMFALAISSMIMAVMFKVFTSQQRTFEAQEETVDMQDDLRAALYLMSNELRMAGYNTGSGNNPLGIIDAQNNSLQFSMSGDWDGKDNDSDGTTDEPEETITISYSLTDYDGDGDDDLIRTTGYLDNGGNVTAEVQQALAENVEKIEFYYRVNDGTDTLSPTNVQLKLITNIQLSILTRSARSINHMGSGQNFASASGVNWNNPSGDSYRRYFMTKNIFLRNIALAIGG